MLSWCFLTSGNSENLRKMYGNTDQHLGESAEAYTTIAGKYYHPYLLYLFIYFEQSWALYMTVCVHMCVYAFVLLWLGGRIKIEKKIWRKILNICNSKYLFSNSISHLFSSFFKL